MRAAEFDETTLFKSIQDAGVRALLIGRRALVLLGLPVLTADYDFWIAIDEIAAFNRAAARCDLVPSIGPEDARKRGRYVLENDEHVDVLVARAVPTVDGIVVTFKRTLRSIFPRWTISFSRNGSAIGSRISRTSGCCASCGRENNHEHTGGARARAESDAGTG